METKHLTKEEIQLIEFQHEKAKEKRNIETTVKCVNYIDKLELDAFKNICSKDFKLFMGSSDPISMNDTTQMIKMFYTAFPDYKHIIENIFASGDNVVMQLILKGTHKNSFQEIPPTNNKIEYKSIQIYKFENDLVKEVHAAEDDLTMMTQIGLQLK